MTNAYRVGKQAFAWVTVVTTILWSMGFAALAQLLVPLAAQAAAPNLQAGDLIQFEGDPNKAVYVMGSDMKRYYFPTLQVFETWHKKAGVANFESLQKIAQEYSDNWAVGGGVNPRAGACFLVKSPVSPNVYAILPGNKKAKLSSPEIAEALYGSNWGSCLAGKQWSDIFDANLTVADPLTESKFHDGQLVQEVGKLDVYQVSGGQLYKVEGTLSDAAKGDIRAVGSLSTYTTAATTVTAASVVANPAQKSGTTTTPGDTSTPATGNVSVALAANTPPAGYIAKGAYNAEFAKFTFKATSGAAKVDKIIIKRDGLGTDSDIEVVRIYDGAKQIGSDQALNTNSHTATFNNINWELAAGETRTLTVTANTATSTSGTNDYFTVTEVVLEAGGTVTGYPVSGNAMQFHSVTVGELNVSALTSPGATTLISGALNQEVACIRLNTDSNEGFSVKSFRLTNNGTIANDEISNFVLRDGATTLVTNSGTFASDGKITLDFGEKPYFIDKSKTKDLCLSVDIKGGITTSKTIIVQIAESKDVVAVGDNSKAQVVIEVSSATFTAQSSQTMTVGQGSLTIARNTATLPVAATLIDGVTRNKVAAYKFTAGSTEGAIVTRFRLTVSGTNVAAADFSNFQLYEYNETTSVETAIGSSQSISGSTVTFEDTADGLFTVDAGKNKIIHAYADVNSAAAYSDFNVYVGSTNTNLIAKAKGTKSNEYFPAASISLSSVSDAAANVVLFQNGNTGSLAVSLDNSSPSATSIAKGVTDFDFAHYRLYATGEDSEVTSLVVRAYSSSGTGVTASTTNEFTNVRLYDITSSTDPRQLGTTVSTPSAGGVSTFSFSLTVPKDGYKVLKVVADVPTANNGAGFLHFDVPGAGTVSSDITSIGSFSRTDITETGSATGRLMTIATPSLTVSIGTTPAAQSVVVNSQGTHVATIQLRAGDYENIRVTSIKVSVDDAAALNSASAATATFSNLKLIDSEDATKQYGITKNLTNGTPSFVTFDGIDNLVITAGQTKLIYVKVNVDASNAGPWYFGVSTTSDIVATGQVSGSSATVSGTGVGTAQTVTANATVTFTRDSSTTAIKVVAVGTGGSGEEVSMLAMDVDPSFENIDMTKLVFQYVPDNGDTSTAAFADGGIKLYKKVNGGSEVLVGSTSLVSSTDFATAFEARFSLAAGTLIVGKDDTTVLIVKAKFNGTSNGTSAAMSPKLQFGDGSSADTLSLTAKGISSNAELAAASINGSNTLNISGNDKVLYRSYPTFTHVNLPSTGNNSLVNGVENDIYKFTVAAASTGNVSLKQIRFGIDVVDNIGTNNGQTLGTFKFYRGNTDISSDVIIVSSTGALLESGGGTISTGTSQFIYVVWTGTNEESITAGTTESYTLKATPSNFVTDADNDYIRVRIDNTEATTEISDTNDTYYVGQKGLSNNAHILVLSGSTVTTTTTSDLIWSDRSATGHSAATTSNIAGTASSTADWFNGYYVDRLPTDYATLTY